VDGVRVACRLASEGGIAVPTATVNGVRLFYALTGAAGPPLALVHGAWGDLASWDPVVPILAHRFRVLAYDRRGHSRSERPPGQGSVEEDVADLAALLEHLGLAPAHVAGFSFGGNIALRLAARRPDLVRSLAVHEPGLFGLLADDPDHGPAMREMLARIGAVAARLAAGDVEGGTRQFMEAARGPGAWEPLPPAGRQRLVFNAPTVVDEARDPAASTLDLAALAGFRRPVLLTHGDRRFPDYRPILAALAAALPRAETRRFAGAGHLPHESHPDEYAASVAAFAEAAEDAGPS
jgi:pimeloyl-ACP methyl ester carboxylesterase